MYELVVEEDRIQGAPPIMPLHVEVWLEGEEAAAALAAASEGELFVRVGSPEGERQQVKGIWRDPHTPQRLTLFLG